MKVVLIKPEITTEQVFGDWDLSGVDSYCPPLGLLYIASFIRKHNHVPFIFDLYPLKWPLEKLVQEVLSLNPDVVGISATTLDIINAKIIAERLKERGLCSPIVIGGPHATALPVETLKKCEAMDFGVMGEGEITFLELIDRIRNKETVSSIKGLVWRDGNGQVIRNSPRPLIADLDILPLPAWDLLPNFPGSYPNNALETKRLPAATIMTSRGCPYHCTFCDRSVFGNTVRTHSVDYTVEMMRHLIERYKIRDLMILDDIFLLNKNRLFHICDRMIEEKFNLTWYCLAHFENMTKDRLRKIREAGCWIIEAGIESGCDRILKLIKKNTTRAKIVAGMRIAKEEGIKVKGNIILGFPTETKESLEETIQFASRLDLFLLQQTFLTILPGSELAREAHNYGSFDSDWTKTTVFKANFMPLGLTKKDLTEASKDAFRRFYLRPKVILKILLHSLTSLRAMRVLLVAVLAFSKTITRKSDEGLL